MKGESERTEQLVADMSDLLRTAIDEIVRERLGALLASLTGGKEVRLGAARPKRPGRAPRSSAPASAPTKGGSVRRCGLCREPGHRATNCPQNDDAEGE